MRFVSWNAWGLRGGPRAFTAALRSLDADVVCLQECPRWPGGRLVMRWLARSAGLRLAAGAGRSGVAVLIDSTLAVPASGTRLRPRPGLRPRYPRGEAWVRLDSDHGDLLVLSAHLDIEPRLRTHHAQALADRLRSAPRAVLAGDLNEPAGGPAWRILLSDGAVDGAAAEAAPTFPQGYARRPAHRIDAVVLRGLGVARSGAIPADFTARTGRPVSDHLPVIVDVAVP